MSSSEVFGTVRFDPPKSWPIPCSVCGGQGVTGVKYGMKTDRCTLLVDVFCPACGGCGNGAPRHRGCRRRPVRTFHPAWVDRYDDDFEQPDEGKCWSCQGRHWNPVQAFAGEDDDVEMLVLRVPCGCTTDRVQFSTEVPADVR